MAGPDDWSTVPARGCRVLVTGADGGGHARECHALAFEQGGRRLEEGVVVVNKKAAQGHSIRASLSAGPRPRSPSRERL